MGNGKRIIDKDFTEAGEDASEGWIIFFFAWMEARVVHQEDIARLRRGDSALMKAVFPIRGHKLYYSSQALLKRGSQRGKRVFGDDLASGSLEVREHDDNRALGRQFREGRNGMTNARIVADATVFHGHVEIGADDDPLSGNVDPVEDAKWRCHSSLPIATAVSLIRFEKPHSLSYQLITRTKVPSMTLV